MNEMKMFAKGKPYTIFILYADYCSHCQEMKRRLKKKMVNTETIQFVEEKDIDENLRDYYPHIYYFKNGRQQKDLTVNQLVAFLN